MRLEYQRIVGGILLLPYIVISLDDRMMGKGIVFGWLFWTVFVGAKKEFKELKKR